MTAERKQAEGYLANNGYGTGTNFTFSSVAGLLTAYASLKVAEATKEMYPISFMIWKDKHVHYDEEDNLYFVTTDDEKGIGVWLILEAVFEYWKQNIRK